MTGVVLVVQIVGLEVFATHECMLGSVRAECFSDNSLLYLSVSIAIKSEHKVILLVESSPHSSWMID